jgi:hypothetical protein
MMLLRHQNAKEESVCRKHRTNGKTFFHGFGGEAEERYKGRSRTDCSALFLRRIRKRCSSYTMH